ncbi:MAG TPA: hypothetical protein VIX19_09295, partial [Terriglobales bacterium]
MTKQVELPQGTLEMLILKAVSLGPLHGYGILLRIQQISGARLEILQGSFYTAVYRLERGVNRRIKLLTGENPIGKVCRFGHTELLSAEAPVTGLCGIGFGSVAFLGAPQS